MNFLKRAPWGLTVAAITIVIQTLLSFAFDPSILKATSIPVSLFFAALMLLGSRFAWMIILISAAGQLLGLATADRQWGELAASGIVAVCILVPPSVRYVWSRRPNQRAEGSQPAIKLFYEMKVVPLRVLAWVAEWEDGKLEPGVTRKPRSYRLLIWRLGVGCVILFLLFGAAYNWQQGSGSDKSIANVLVSVTWAAYILVQLIFIVFSMIAAYQYLAGLKEDSESSQSQ